MRAKKLKPMSGLNSQPIEASRGGAATSAASHPWGLLAVLLLLVWPASLGWSQGAAPSGRFSLFYDWSDRELPGGESADLSQLIMTLSLGSRPSQQGGLEYELDGRFATFPGAEGRRDRRSLYEAWVGFRSHEGRFRVRAGQIWLDELGRLGSVGGVAAEYRLASTSAVGQIRVGAFAGLEPTVLDIDYASHVKKGGVYVAVEGAHGRRHTLGWVRIRNRGVTERSAVYLSNFIPVAKKLHLYQVAEYDLGGGIAGLGDSELRYLFGNLRYTISSAVSVQATYHRGRSIDARGLTQDHLDGRAVSPASLEGLLYESGRLRVNLRPWRTARLWLGWGRDRNNRGEQWNDRVTAGVSLADLLGCALTVSYATIDRDSGSYDTTYVSLGRSFGQRLAMTLDYTSSLSVFRYQELDGGIVEIRPESTRWSLSANVHLNRTLSLLIVGELTDHDSFDELRLLTGFIIRF